MSKLQLPSVTLCIIDCLNIDRSIKVLEHCKQKVDFGAVRFLTSIPTDYPDAVKIMPLNSLIAYSIFMLTRFHEYIDTEHVQIIQRDGWILNTQSFDQSWLELDFIGPLFMQMDRCGSGGFSLRSKKIMRDISATMPTWDGTQKDAERIQRGIFMYEDGELSISQFSKNYKIATPEQASKYANGGNRNKQYFEDFPYGFHRTFSDINFLTGKVDSSDITKDVTASYDHIIDSL